ncbi:hypothetical protein FA13DRAFT_1711929 [Coprinellus micaceus]|uniref:Uncharacterized protein n=1 Tax=Coprinellus micaceus TaxID=71717 RepID=A0A4Y7T2I3_COPMI|nr:hypothetical protein FA13DRAFT_1711929 [Coprinellus micaceus]
MPWSWFMDGLNHARVFAVRWATRRSQITTLSLEWEKRLASAWLTTLKTERKRPNATRSTMTLQAQLVPSVSVPRRSTYYDPSCFELFVTVAHGFPLVIVGDPTLGLAIVGGGYADVPGIPTTQISRRVETADRQRTKREETGSPPWNSSWVIQRHRLPGRQPACESGSLRPSVNLR